MADRKTFEYPDDRATVTCDGQHKKNGFTSD